MEEMLRTAQHHAAETQQFIVNEGLDLLGLKHRNTKARLAALGLKIDTRMLEIPARFLPAPRISYNGSHKDPTGASWSLVDSYATMKFRQVPKTTLNKGIYALDFTTGRSRVS